MPFSTLKLELPLMFYDKSSAVLKREAFYEAPLPVQEMKSHYRMQGILDGKQPLPQTQLTLAKQ